MDLDMALGHTPLATQSSAGPRLFVRAWHHVVDHFIPHSRNDYHPHLLGHRVMGLFAMLLMVAKGASIALLTLSPALPAESSAITQATVVSLTNQSRQEAGLPALLVNAKLNQAAETKAAALLECQCFSHNIGTKTPWDFIKAAGYQYIMAGENLAVNFIEAEDEHQAWMNSPGHRANILNTNFKEIGIGIISGAYQGGTSTMVVQLFGNPAAQDVQLSEKPTEVVKVPAAAPEVKIAPAETKQKAGLAPRSAQASEPKPAEVVTEQISQPTAPGHMPEIDDANILREGEDLVIRVATKGGASRVIASYGQEAIELRPTSDTTWEGRVPLQKLTEGNRSIHIRIFDINGQVAGTRVASFASDITTVFAAPQKDMAKKASLFGIEIDPNALLNRFYLLFIAGLLSTIILAIAIKRHVQHVHMIANSSFVAIIATLLWWSGI
jgi:uncharacterized protein YkwD